MSIKDQIKTLRRIGADLEKEHHRLEDSPARVDVANQIEAINWAVLTLENVSQLLERLTWLTGVVKD